MKQSYPSLFKECGFNEIDELDIYPIFVEPFEHSTRRPMLATKLREYIEQIKTIFHSENISAELWIDGSFSTEKLEPDDVDLVVAAKGSELNTIKVENQNKLRMLLDNNFTKVNYNCDVYFSNSEDAQNRSYWRGWFLFDRDEKPKGVARVTI